MLNHYTSAVFFEDTFKNHSTSALTITTQKLDNSDLTAIYTTLTYLVTYRVEVYGLQCQTLQLCHATA